MRLLCAYCGSFLSNLPSIRQREELHKICTSCLKESQASVLNEVISRFKLSSTWKPKVLYVRVSFGLE